MVAGAKVRVMISSTVYGIESLLDQIYAVLTGYDYEVWMSCKGTLPTDPRKSNFENCLDAVENCEVFLGIITGKYGSGQALGEISITHQEVRRAVQLEKLRWFLVHHDVTIARQLLKQFRFDDKGKPLPLTFKRTAVLEDIRVLEMYEEAIQQNLPLSERRGNWVQEYFKEEEILRFLAAQFADPERIRKMLFTDEKEETL